MTDKTKIQLRPSSYKVFMNLCDYQYPKINYHTARTSFGMGKVVWCNHIHELKRNGLIRTEGSHKKPETIVIHVLVDRERVEKKPANVSGKNPVNSKPKAKIYPGQKKTRSCLNCREKFVSEWIGERVCKTCKSSLAWKSGGDAEYVTGAA
ncbi:hypothetical protein [Kiloniella antarctica]|uniref:Uncharacterized protein n=1 Tax=Kiloniella antarctica TaxID=1550907 RepID=A0ABW5BQN3_9PROT